ncbi:MAG: type II toxin-antitoxin system HicA family toxin [Rhodomicrobium sp.]
MVPSCMNAGHRKTLAAIFAKPAKADVRWESIEALFVALGAEISEGRGSRVRVLLNGTEAVFHRPHPQPVTDKGALKSVRRFLSEAGIEP